MKKQLKFHVVVRFCLFLVLLVSLFIPVHLASATPIQNIHWFDRFFKKDQKVIVIDAGHGGTDPGSVKQGIQEKDINLQIAQKLQKRLEAKGYKVVMTRTDDTAISLSNRAKLANQAKGDLLISIHQNSFKDASVHGIEVFYTPGKKTYDNQLANFIQEALINYTQAKDRHVREVTNLLVIRESRMPACLIESAYLSNDHERNLIQTEYYQDKIVTGIIEGIENFLNDKQKAANL